jgi:hypothetical protein
MTYVDEIFKKGANKMLPQPGPQSYFLSKRSLSKLDAEKAELVRSEMKNPLLVKKPGPQIRAKRTFVLVANYEEKKKQPGPSSYYPYVRSTFYDLENRGRQS